MSWRHLVLVCALCLISVYSANAQETLRLRFQVVRNGTVVANSEMSVKPGSTERFEIKDVVSVGFIPMARDAGLRVAFDIKAGDKRLQPQLVIDRSAPGVISWTSPSGELIKITITFV